MNETPTDRDKLLQLLRDKTPELRKFLLDQFDSTGRIDSDALLSLGEINSKAELHQILTLGGLRFNSFAYNEKYDNYSKNHCLKIK